MTDRQLIHIAREFRRGLIGNRDGDQMCFAVCAPLQSLLSGAYGFDTQLVEGWVNLHPGSTNHFWLALLDGRILDPTADQWTRASGRKFPKVYLGTKPEFYRESAD